MKATIDLPDGLIKNLKRKALEQDRTLRSLVTELLESGLRAEQPSATRRRVQFPLIECGPADPGQDITADQVAEILLDLDVDATH